MEDRVELIFTGLILLFLLWINSGYFNWEGNPVNMLLLDREVKSISVDNDDNNLFGITENEEGASEIVVFELAET